MNTRNAGDTFSLHTVFSDMRLSTRNRSGSPSQRREIIASYWKDWALTILLATAFFALNIVSGHKREFSVDDPSLRHTFAVQERVPNWALYFIAFVSPLVLSWVINYFTVRHWWDAHSSALGTILALGITGAITQFVKLTVGRPRPDILDRCNIPTEVVDPPHKLSDASICNQPNWHLFEDGFRSFPSGHSSLSFAGLGFLTFYLMGKLHLFDERGHAPKAWLALAPLSAASLVAISRTMDNRRLLGAHWSILTDHWQDVLVGSTLGLLVSYFCYRQYYPSLAALDSHQPFAPRTDDTQDAPLLPTHAYAPAPYYVDEDASEDVDSGTTARPPRIDDPWRQGQQQGGDEVLVSPRR
ncbi:acid phosphatase/Vanadium-dependent haloperoxidase [Peniophora sp. CONT]|nr:acid phosphatase/Vanadium-dependent haloperoxidase [Peniophora sp. CONT]